jgi:MoaA/NifB/PqqE/SkfB family radical SAM enzyme
MITPQQIQQLIIEATSHCNLHCPQCDRFDQQGFNNKYMELGHLDFFKVEKNLDINSMVNLETVRLEGDHGDAGMHPDIEKIIAYLSASNVKSVELVTNGSLRSRAWWNDLARYPKVTVTFSIDGLEDTNHIYRINSNWEKIIANASAFIKAGGRAKWKYIIFKHNEHQVDQARSLSQDMGFIKFDTHVTNRNFYQKNQFPIMIDGVYQNNNLEMASSTQSREHTKIITMRRSENEFDFQPPTCTWLNRGAMYIDYIGNIIPCCMTSGLMWRKDMSGKLWRKIVGDPESISLYKHHITDVLASDFYHHRLKDSFQSIRTAHHACVGNCSK